MSELNFSVHSSFEELIPMAVFADEDAESDGSALDVRDWDWAYIVAVVKQDATALNATTTFTFQSSADGSTGWSDITDDTSNMTDGGTDDVVATFDNAVGASSGDGTDEIIFGEIDLRQQEGYIRAQVDPSAGSAGTAQIGVYVILTRNTRTTNVSNTLAFQILTKNKSAW